FVYLTLETELKPATVVVRGRGIVASRILQRLYEARARNKRIRIVHQMRTPKEEGAKYGRARRPVFNHTELQPFNWPKGCWGGELRYEIERATPERRALILSTLDGTSTADRADWIRLIREGLAEGWYQVAIGNLNIVGPGSQKNDPKIHMRYEGPTKGIPRDILVDYVIDCTGLEGDVTNSPFLRDLIETYRLERSRDARGGLRGFAVTPDFEVLGLANGPGHVYAAGQITGYGPQAAVDSFLGMQ